MINKLYSIIKENIQWDGDESELLPKRSHIAVRVHKDDIISSNDLRMEYLTIKEYNKL